MSNFISILIATLVTIPLIGWYIVYIITIKVTRRKAKAFRLAADLSAILFIVAVHFILIELTGRSFLWLILLVIFFIAFVFTFIHWREGGDIHVSRLLKGVWRTNFLLFFFAYVILSVYGLSVRIFFI